MLKNYDVAVVFGGVSGENEVSVITGAMVCNVLKNGGKSVLPVYINHSGEMLCGEKLADVSLYGRGYPKAVHCAMANGGFITYKNGRGKAFAGVSCIVNCCHGGCGEGGGVAGAAELNNIPLASAGIFESSAFMSKYYTKLILSSLGVRTAEYAYFRDEGSAVSYGKGCSYPRIIKPCNLGSSIGIAKADDFAELKSAVKAAFELDSAVIIEEYFSPRREVNVAAYAAEGEIVVSPPEETTTSGDILSYDDKYSGGGVRIFPAELGAALGDNVRETAKRIYGALGMCGIVRFDFIIYKGDVYLSEVNTTPGSLSQYLLSENYRDFYGTLCENISLAIKRRREFMQKRIFPTGILNNITPNACKIK